MHVYLLSIHILVSAHLYVSINVKFLGAQRNFIFYCKIIITLSSQGHRTPYETIFLISILKAKAAEWRPWHRPSLVYKQKRNNERKDKTGQDTNQCNSKTVTAALHVTAAAVSAVMTVSTI